MRVLLVVLSIWTGTLGFLGCSSSTIAPSVEVISPIQSLPVEYVPRPANVLGTLLFSSVATEQEKADIWSESRGKWVMWVGSVEAVEPKLKPSRLIFLYEYDTSGLAIYNKFGVAVDFNPSMTERLKQLTIGQRVYYRARLGQRESATLYTSIEYGSGISGFLVLSEGELVAADDPQAVLADLAYASYEQLEELVAEAERVTAVSKYFERELEQGWTGIAIETGLNFLNVKLYDEPWLQVLPLPEKRSRKASIKSEIEDALEAALAFLHSNEPKHDWSEDIEQKSENNRKVVESTQEAGLALDSTWRIFKQSPGQIDRSDIAKTAATTIDKLRAYPGIVSGAVAIAESVGRLLDLDVYDQIVGSCYALLDLIDVGMEHVYANVLRAIDNIARPD